MGSPAAGTVTGRTRVGGVGSPEEAETGSSGEDIGSTDPTWLWTDLKLSRYEDVDSHALLFSKWFDELGCRKFRKDVRGGCFMPITPLWWRG